ncbi:MAG: FecCD family ABC transporter permease [bacterium]
MKVGKSHIAWLFLLSGITLLFFIINISLGSVRIPFNEVFNGLFGLPMTNQNWEYIIFDYRMPKAITSVLVGTGLGVSGLLMQTLFRNPLAGPFVLGITSGASLGVALIILGASAFGFTFLAATKWNVIIAASLGCFLVLLAVIAVSSKVRDTMAILIIGLMFASFTSSVVSVFSYFSSAEALQQFIFWGFGSLGNLSWQEVAILGLLIFIGLLLCLFLVKRLDALLLGDNYAQTLGINLKKVRLLIIIVTSILAGTITAFAGPIAFIGLAVPHFARLLFSTASHKILLPATIFLGAIILLICDSVAQVPFYNYTLPINAVTSLIGAPIIIWLLVRKRKLNF